MTAHKSLDDVNALRERVNDLLARPDLPVDVREVIEALVDNAPLLKSNAAQPHHKTLWWQLNLMDVLQQAIKNVISDQPWQAKVNDLVNRLGYVLGAVRVDVVQVWPDNLCVVHAHYIDSAYKTHPVMIESDMPLPLLPRWLEAFRGNRPIYGEARFFPHNEQMILTALDIQSLLLLPIFVEDRWWGLLCLYDQVGNWQWSAESLHLLKLVAELLGMQRQINYHATPTNREVSRLRLAVEGAHDGIFEWDFEQGTLHTSGQWQKQHPKSHQLDVDAILDLVHPDDKERLNDEVNDFLAQVAAVFVSEYRLKSDSTSYRWYAVRAYVLYDAHRQPKYVVGTLSDITDIRRDEQSERDQRHMIQQLFTTFRALNTTLELDEVIRVALERSIEFFPYTVMSYLVLDTNYQIDHMTSYAPALTPQVEHHTYSKPLDVEAVSLLFTVARTRRMRHEPSMVVAEKDLYFLMSPSLVQFHKQIIWNHASLIAIPVILEGQLHGIVVLLHHEAHVFTSQRITQIQSFLEQMLFSMKRALLHQREKDIAAEEERRRIASDLHDVVSQTLFSANMIAQILPRLWHKNQAEAEIYLHDLHTMTHTALTEMRMLLLELRPESLTKTDLESLLRNLVDSFIQRTGIEPQLQILGTVRLLEPDVQIAFYRIAQEALNNVNKHAGANQVTIKLQFTELQVALQIVDDGVGFNIHEHPTGHMGIDIMRERAKQVGAYLHINSQYQQGTTVTAQWRDNHK